MTKNNTSRLRDGGLWATALLAAAFIVFHFWAVFQNVGTTKCLEPYRDGVKTPINAAYHTQYDPSFTWYGGMNYPYREHIVAATELPGYAILLKLLHPVFPGITQYVFGMAYLLLLVCMLLGAVFMYLIFRELKIAAWYAVPVAIGLMLLSPQNMRFAPHMGLAPLFVIPAMLYGLLLFEKKPRLAVDVFVAAVVVVASLFHFYFFAITVFTISFYFLFSLLRNFSWARAGRMALHYAVMVLAPLALFLGWMILNDPVADRSPKPYGFLVYRARWESIYTSQYLPLYQWIDKHIIAIEKADFEGWSYVGMVAGFFTLVFLLKTIWYLARVIYQKTTRKEGEVRPLFAVFSERERQFYLPLLLTGIVMFFWSCSQPVATWEPLLQYIGPLRQFRSTGRFAWVFFYIINLLAFVVFYKTLLKWKRKPLRVLGFVAVIGVLLYEGYLFVSLPQVYSEQSFYQIPELVPGQRFTDIPGIDYARYQAIVPVPYYNIGSNNFGADGGTESVQKSLVLSLQTGLPVTGAMLTRSSRHQSFNQLQMVTEPYREPLVFDDYPNGKPLLLLYSKAISPEDQAQFGHLAEESTLLHDTPGWSLWEMDLDSFRRRIANRKHQLNQQALADSLFQVGEFRSTDSLRNFVLVNFDSLKSAKACLGPGAFEGPCGAANLVFDGPVPHAEAGAAYHLLAWVFANDDRFSATGFRLREIAPTGEVLQEPFFMVMFQDKTYDPRGWVLMDCPFTLKSDNSRLTLTFQLDEGDDRPIWVDELLIKQQQTQLYRMEEKGIWWNDRWYE
ncbi:MAG: hypothetical protein R2830_26820 [Saprospiraceae bacterium]